MTVTGEKILDLTALRDLQAQWPEDLLPEIQKKLNNDSRKVVVLDDDPTGTQTVQGIPVLTHWDEETLEEMLTSEHPGFFILTNSRALPGDEACTLGRELGEILHAASTKSGVDTVVISRSDSTLRGHFPSEVYAVSEPLGMRDAPLLLIPFFLEGGRFTLNDVHYVRELDQLVPAAATPFARDRAFGFSTSNLKKYIEEKTGGVIPAEEVTTVSLEDIRSGGVERVASILNGVTDKAACIINSTSYRDMEVVVNALLSVEERGKRFLYRTAASFVRTRFGQRPDGKLLQRSELIVETRAGGLFVIGSYVEKTSKQLRILLQDTDVQPVEVKVNLLLDNVNRNFELKRLSKVIHNALDSGDDVALFTSRELISASSGEESLAIGKVVSEALVELVRGLQITPRFLVAKGGITSSDVATRGLGVTKAMVQGQILPGVPVWKLGNEARFAGMSYIVFPGNVGDDKALAAVQQKLAREGQ